ncbi:MAG TPA: hypothetical protein VHW01_27250 [Polyangiaceae bacterium]|nr:hypothetical protein [Polyangiaceae bacterium]
MVDINKRRGGRNAIRLSIEDVAFVAELHRELGPSGAAQELGFGRGAVLGVMATGKGAPGTGALIREARARRGTQA